MTISELICRLQAIKCEHGDLFIAVRDDLGDMIDANDVTTVSGVSYLDHMDGYAVIEPKQ